MDDLNTQVGAWGAPVKTPAIDRLAARGVRFDHAYVQVAMCSPSRVSMLTGWRPERTGVWQNEDPPRPSRALPLQELFAAHGARTLSVGKVLHSPGGLPLGRAGGAPGGREEEHDPARPGRGSSGLWVKAPGGDLDQPDGRRARRAAELLGAHGTDPSSWPSASSARTCAGWRPSATSASIRRRRSRRAPTRSTISPTCRRSRSRRSRSRCPASRCSGASRRASSPTPRFLREATAAYRACVSFADAQVGVVLDALDRADLWKDTVVVLVGDNGFHLGEHGGLLRKDTLFEEALHVPLIVAAPGLVHPGAVVRAPVELLDVYPTIVELAGLREVRGPRRREPAPLLAEPGGSGRGAAVSYRRVQPPRRGWSLRTESARYTLWPDGSEELYDLRSRSGESENLAGRADRADEKARLRARLGQLVRRGEGELPPTPKGAARTG